MRKIHPYVFGVTSHSFSVCVVDTSCSTSSLPFNALRHTCEMELRTQKFVERNREAELCNAAISNAARRLTSPMGVLCFSLSYEFTFYKYIYLRWSVSCERSVRFQTCFMFIFITYAYKMRLWILRQQQQQKTSKKKTERMNRMKTIALAATAKMTMRIILRSTPSTHWHWQYIHVIVSSKYFANVFPENYLPTSERYSKGEGGVDEGRERRCISMCIE